MSVGRDREQTQNAPRYGGFDERGSWFTSEGPVQNAITNFVRAMIRKIASDSYGPQDVAMELDGQPDFIRYAFPWREQWRSLEGKDRWFSAWTSTSAESCLKYNRSKPRMEAVRYDLGV